MKRSSLYILIATLLGQMASPPVLAAYTYDALGRRITATIGNTTTRYYYDGQRVIEERDAADNLVRYHVGPSQYIDERVATLRASHVLTRWDKQQVPTAEGRLAAAFRKQAHKGRWPSQQVALWGPSAASRYVNQTKGQSIARQGPQPDLTKENCS